MYVPLVEVDARQSNFDELHRDVRRGVAQRRHQWRERGPLPQTYSKTDFAPLGFAYDITGDAQRLGGCALDSTRASLHPQNPRSASPPPSRDAGATTLRVSDGRARGGPEPPGVGDHALIFFDINFRDGYARNWNINLQKQLGTNYMVEVAYVGSQGRNMLLKGDPNQAPPSSA